MNNVNDVIELLDDVISERPDFADRARQAIALLEGMGSGSEAVAYADPHAFTNFANGTATKEWMWAKHEEGLEPLFRHTPTQTAAVPDGWKLVPVEPTREMLNAGVNAGVSASPEPWCPAAYRAMLIAAPTAPNGRDWLYCEKVAAAPKVDEKLCIFAEDSTHDNAICLIREILSVTPTPTKKQTRSQIPDGVSRVRNVVTGESVRVEKAANVWEMLPAYLIENCEGEVISEEFIQQALSEMMKGSRYVAPASLGGGEKCDHGKCPNDYCEPCGRIHGGG